MKRQSSTPAVGSSPKLRPCPQLDQEDQINPSPLASPLHNAIQTGKKRKRNKSVSAVTTSKKRKENDREKGGDGKRDRFRRPVDRHDQDYISRLKLLVP